MDILTNQAAPVNFVLRDGPHFIPVINEWVIVIGDKVEGWAGDERTARDGYQERLGIQCRHFKRNPNLYPTNPAAIVPPFRIIEPDDHLIELVERSKGDLNENPWMTLGTEL